MVQALNLALACFSYDFVGTVNDETLDEAINIQVPTKWKPSNLYIKFTDF